MNAPSLHWGERTDLLTKRSAYVFSLDINYATELRSLGPVSGGILIPLHAQGSTRWSTYHVFDEDLVTTVDGVVREVPRTRVVNGSDRMRLDSNGILNLEGRLLLQSEAGSGISVEYGGVIKIAGLRAHLIPAIPDKPLEADEKGPTRLSGSAYLATRHESQHTKFRWLVQNQLVGFGTAVATIDWKSWYLDLSIDLYSVG